VLGRFEEAGVEESGHAVGGGMAEVG
jgi:hypothetical protein